MDLPSCFGELVIRDMGIDQTRGEEEKRELRKRILPWRALKYVLK
jgi:hypothetical protein